MKKALLALKIAVSIILVVLLTRQVSFAEVGTHLLQVRMLPALAALVLFGVSLALMGWRWHVVAGGRIGLAACLRFTWIAQLYGMILPGALSADVAKGVVMTTQRESNCAATLSASIVLDRVAGLGSMLVFGLLSCLGRPGLLPLSPEMLVGLAVLGTVGLMVLPWILRRVLPRFAIAPGTWWWVLVLSVLVHAVNTAFYSVALMAVGGHESWWQMGIYTCLLNFALILPVSIAGIGLREQVALMLFQASGNAAVQVAFAWLVLMLNVVHALVGLALQWRPARGRALGATEGNA
ncbi:MAG: lysylphosphatidylglycerol synthase transmembrane domain-containing protein [Prosthecobacter sp.]